MGILPNCEVHSTNNSNEWSYKGTHTVGNFRHVKIKEMWDSVSFCRAEEGRYVVPNFILYLRYMAGGGGGLEIQNWKGYPQIEKDQLPQTDTTTHIGTVQWKNKHFFVIFKCNTEVNK